MYIPISDLFVTIAPLVARPDPERTCTDAVLIALAIVGECYEWDQETMLLSYTGVIDIGGNTLQNVPLECDTLDWLKRSTKLSSAR
jgi:hypothetical protein